MYGEQKSKRVCTKMLCKGVNRRRIRETCCPEGETCCMVVLTLRISLNSYVKRSSHIFLPHYNQSTVILASLGDNLHKILQDTYVDTRVTYLIIKFLKHYQEINCTANK